MVSDESLPTVVTSTSRLVPVPGNCGTIDYKANPGSLAVTAGISVDFFSSWYSNVLFPKVRCKKGFLLGAYRFSLNLRYFRYNALPHRLTL